MTGEANIPATYEPGSTIQLEDYRRGAWWKQHGVDSTAYGSDGHRYAYGAITSPQGATHFGYALHSTGCRCVLEQIIQEREQQGDTND